MTRPLKELNRRHVLNSAFYAALGTAVGGGIILSRKDKVEELSPSRPSLPVQPPSPLAQEKPFQIEAPPQNSGPLDYASFLAQFQFNYIRPHEIINPHRQSIGQIANTLPPKELWSAMPATLFLADEIRNRLGRPLKLITSAYRNPEYNRACGGASRSWHTQNCALDLVYEGGPRDAYAIAIELREAGLFRGGIGLYNSFIHLDTRGENATWQG